jgi:trehalose-6-phosphatase
MLTEEAGPDAALAYFGDDMTDEQAFEAVGPDDLTVLVRPLWRRTAAKLWLKPPDELLACLRRWVEVTA